MSHHALSIIEVGSLVDRIYDDVLGGAPLEKAIDLIRSKLSAACAVLTIEGRSQASERVMVVSGDDEYADDGMHGAIADRASRLRTCDSVLPRWLEHSHHITAADAGQQEKYNLWMFRSRGAAPFAEDDAGVCAMLLSHMRRAMEFSARMDSSEAERRLYSSVMDKLLVGAVLLDRKGFVLQTTPTASSALNQRNGLQLLGGKLSATSAKDDKAFQAAVKDALGRQGERTPTMRALSLTRPSGARNLGVIVQPLGADETWHGIRGAAVAIFIRDPEICAEVETGLLCELFDLTPAEATVAHRLANGLSLEEAAESLDISRNTVRAHLRSIFSKSGITRQTELVRLMLNSAAVLGARSKPTMQ